MATSYNRQINLYINGKQVSNDLKSIRAEMARLVNEQARMTIGSDEYIRHAQGIRQLRGMIAEHNRQISAVSQSWIRPGSEMSLQVLFHDSGGNGGHRSPRAGF